MSSCGVCLSVCVSVTFVDCIKTNKDIFEIFSPSGSHTILVFRTKWNGDIPTRTPPPTGTSNTGGVGRNRDSQPVCLLLTLQQARYCQHGRLTPTASVSSRGRLRSASSSRYEQPQMRLHFGQRCFSYAAPAAWNTLPPGTLYHHHSTTH